MESIHFNSQPHKEADMLDNPTLEIDRDFNSQPHKEADRVSLEILLKLHISTHSLTRRLTVMIRLAFAAI